MFGLFNQILGVQNLLPQQSNILSSQIIIQTTSTSATWSPAQVINSGSDITWEYEGTQIQTISGSTAPTFNLTGSGGSATITATSTTAFSGFTKLL